MKVCTNCNTVNTDEAQFCAKCGAPLPPSQPVNNGYQQPAYQQPLPERPSSHLGLAITSTIMCCPPLGIPAIVYAASVNSKYDQGDYAAASRNASRAKSFAIWGMVLGVIFWILYLIFAVGYSVFVTAMIHNF